ncbi:hypothetical protein V8D89_005311 [Ganoderma adspersum]
MSTLAIQVYDFQTVTLACVAVSITVYAIRWYADPLRAIPTVGGPSLPGLAYLAARYSPPDSREVFKEGYQKYPNSAFKVGHLLGQWVVVVCGRRMVEELRKRPDEELSAHFGLEELTQSKHYCEHRVLADPYHGKIVQDKLTRIHPDLLAGVVDEIAVAVREHFQVVGAGNGWTSIRAMFAMRDIVARATGRAIFGLPLGRDRGYITLAFSFALYVTRDARFLRKAPSFMRPLLGWLTSDVRRHTNLAIPYLRPIIEERMKNSEELGEGWNDKPNDLLQSLLDKAIPKGESMAVIVQRILMVNFGALGTVFNAATHALYHLAENPALLVPLREEIEASITLEGWTAGALSKMWKLDSLLRETLRSHQTSLLSMHRMAMKDITLYDGTRIPRGTIVAAAADPMHHDEAILKNADTFDPFRYARMRSVAADDGLRHISTSTSPEYIPFGHGPHACPGRYFASYELKAILGHIILEYDLKLGGDGEARSISSFMSRIGTWEYM